jgi:hypothetical protein
MNKCRNMQYFFFSTTFETMVHCPSDETVICTIYNMSGRVVSDIQTRAEGESLYIRYNTDANVVNDLKKLLIL